MMKKILKLIIIICLFGYLPIVYASIQTYDRNELDNYGVNKKWTINNSNLNNVLNTPAVDSSEKIYDFADILTDEEEQALYVLICDYIDYTGIDMVFLTVDFNYSNDYENESYAADFYDYNDFGIDSELYDGVLLYRNANESDPYYDIYTFGNGQLYYTYNRLQYVLDYIYDDFVSHNYSSGMENFIDYMIYYYDKGMVEGLTIDENGYVYSTGSSERSIPWLGIFFLSGIITVITICILNSKHWMVRKAFTANMYLDNQSIKYSVIQDKFITSHTTSHIISDNSGGGGSSGHSISHSGSSGGGHGSGGGRHG